MVDAAAAIAMMRLAIRPRLCACAELLRARAGLANAEGAALHLATQAGLATQAEAFAPGALWGALVCSIRMLERGRGQRCGRASFLLCGSWSNACRPNR